jgi:hypothetical protein
MHSDAKLQLRFTLTPSVLSTHPLTVGVEKQGGGSSEAGASRANPVPKLELGIEVTLRRAALAVGLNENGPRGE